MPDSPSNVPYQAYKPKSKRHSHTPSLPTSAPSSPPRTPQPAAVVQPAPVQRNGRASLDLGRLVVDSSADDATAAVNTAAPIGVPGVSPSSSTSPTRSIGQSPSPPASVGSGSPEATPSVQSAISVPEITVQVVSPPTTNGIHAQQSQQPPASTSTSTVVNTTATASSSSSTGPPPLLANARRTSKFRRITPTPAAALSRSPLAPSPLRPAGAAPAHSRTSSTSSQVALPIHAGTTTTLRPPEARMVSSPVVPHPQRVLAGTIHPPHHRTQSLGAAASPMVQASPSPSPSDPNILHRPPPRSDSLSPAYQHQHHPTPSSTPAPPNASPAPISAPFPSASPSANAVPPAVLRSISSSSSTPSSLRLSPVQSPPCSPATQQRTLASLATPYRPGFQPKGVYRPLTDEFLAMRREKRDVGRIERTKLERRLEKLVVLHFPVEGSAASSSASPSSQKEKQEKEIGKSELQMKRPGVGPRGRERRASSFFDLDFESLRSKMRDDPTSLLKGVLGQAQMDVRAAEQRITPWQDDASVSKCICCSSSFHPITNRKHHCRLCGQIICSLPPKRPQRPVPCSFLFVVDPRTRRIEEVSEGVDYGVRKRTSSTIGPGPAQRGKKPPTAVQEDEKFLKGVRVCRLCRPVIMRQQFSQEFATVPTFVRLYDAFISLESEIEDSLPQFQEMVLSLHGSDPDPSLSQDSKALSAVRKRLLESFSQYDALAKRIHNVTLSAQDGNGKSTKASAMEGPSGQERVVMAIMMRANLFLQKNMVPLQSLSAPKPKSQLKSPSSSSSGLPDTSGGTSNGKPGHTNRDLIDPDSSLALSLQPLLEQEALLESFVEEASAHRKFEDAKTLKINLGEVREEIGRVLREGGVEVGGGKKAGRR